jgi:hypothetical protein
VGLGDSWYFHCDVRVLFHVLSLWWDNMPALTMKIGGVVKGSDGGSNISNEKSIGHDDAFVNHCTPVGGVHYGCASCLCPTIHLHDPRQLKEIAAGPKWNGSINCENQGREYRLVSVCEKATLPEKWSNSNSFVSWIDG